MRYRKKPVEINAIQFTGDNIDELNDFTTGFRLRFDIAGDTAQVAEVWDHLHNTWVGVKVGDWIINGVAGEFYPCDETVFTSTYEPVPA